MAAGDALIEAKAKMPHGGWLPWLAEHCKLSERSAQLYMQIARNREAVEARLADSGGDDLSLNEAAGLLMLSADVKKALEFARRARTTSPEAFIALCTEYGFGVFKDESYDMFAVVAEKDRADWYLFPWFLVINDGASLDNGDGLFEHIEWILQKQFKTVEEWLGPEGDRFREYPIPDGFKKRWRAFRAEHATMTIPEIEAEIAKLADYQREHPQPKKRGHR